MFGLVWFCFSYRGDGGGGTTAAAAAPIHSTTVDEDKQEMVADRAAKVPSSVDPRFGNGVDGSDGSHYHGFSRVMPRPADHVRRLVNLGGRVGSGQEVFEIAWDMGRVGSRVIFVSRVGTGHSDST